ncbi:nucleotidyltransferase [Mycoplasma anserisalpingitidis]|uniref:Nucleotidyltransferase n=1 Tax=Mycoplasma anserisalpingitidis TaxID=519450 RepID=A0A5B8JBJ6_9MOLU|nr:nucleotidyltransferase [Mycoplasma anserisalpingitidis]QDY86573.1 nucleotidyltransferase [Mycoplasma anserisalpingitidis]
MFNNKIKVGIIAEYNPFHNGHIFQINWIKKQFPNSKIIVALSKKYTQRGELAILSYRKRKKIAKSYGVSKVIPLNVMDTSQAAHIFAQRAIFKLNKQGINYLVFGCESSDINIFIECANLIKNNLDKYNFLVKKYLKEKGNSFPKATNLALQELSGRNIELPNDILANEYVKTIIFNNLDIIPLTHERTVNYHSLDVNDKFASATKIRDMFHNGEDFSKFTPVPRKWFIKKTIQNSYQKLQKIIRNSSPEKLRKYKMVDEGIENLFKKHIESSDYDSFVQKCVSKRYTSSRIKRTLLFILLKIKK